MALIHAENIDVILHNRELAIAADPDATDTASWSRHRPHFTEEEAIIRSSIFAENTGAPLAVIHTSVGRGPELIRRARNRYPRLYMETCPQYLVLDMDMPLGTWGKVNPPLRTESRSGNAVGRHGGWDRRLDGIRPLRLRPTDPPGQHLGRRSRSSRGMTMILGVLLSEGVNKGRLTLERVVELTSANFARRIGASPRKGAIEVGSDADLVMIDLDKEVTIDADMLSGHSDYTPYEGMQLRGWPRMTIAGGEVLYEDGEVDRDTSHRGTLITVAPDAMPVL